MHAPQHPPPAADGLLATLRALSTRPGDAVVSDAGTIGRPAFAARVAAAAEALAASGIGPGVVVGVTLRGDSDHLLASLALLATGAAQITLASFSPAEARAALADRVGAEVLLADGEADALPGRRLLPWPAVLAGLPSGAAPSGPPPPDPDEPAMFFSGSGTTGRPKLVTASFRQLLLRAGVAQGGCEGGRIFCFGSIEHDNAKRMRVFGALLGGTAILSARRGAALATFLRETGAEWVEGSLPHCALLLARAEPLPDGVAMRVSGLRVPAALRRDMMAAVTRRFWVSYGSTEGGRLTAAGPDHHDADEPVGPVLPGMEASILRPDGTEAAPGEPGDIRMRGPGMATGYLDDPAETARRFRKGWFHPGDILSRRADGMLLFHGRADDMMILNGINIFPAEIETVLEGHPAVANAAAMPIPSAAHGEIPVAAVELHPGAATTGEALLAFARARLGLRAPRRVLVLEALPRNPMGKVLKREIAPRFAPAGAA
ncbi:MAG: class I adenylate-forming enzyme family protein [Acetobacteraceae bacterium]